MPKRSCFVLVVACLYFQLCSSWVAWRPCLISADCYSNDRHVSTYSSIILHRRTHKKQFLAISSISRPVYEDPYEANTANNTAYLESRLLEVQVNKLQALPLDIFTSYKMQCSELIPSFAIIATAIHLFLFIPSLSILQNKLHADILPFMFISPLLFLSPYIAYGLWINGFDNLFINFHLKTNLYEQKKVAKEQDKEESQKLLSRLQFMMDFKNRNDVNVYDPKLESPEAEELLNKVALIRLMKDIDIGAITDEVLALRKSILNALLSKDVSMNTFNLVDNQALHTDSLKRTSVLFLEGRVTSEAIQDIVYLAKKEGKGIPHVSQRLKEFQTSLEELLRSQQVEADTVE